MRENANSAMAYFGATLARHVATVPVGIRSPYFKSRDYTSNTQQPCCESFVHGVAALCCIHHFLDPTAYDPGLYQMGSADPSCLSGKNHLPGGESLASLANHAATLSYMLSLFADILDREHPRRGFSVVPAIYEHLQKLASPSKIAKELRNLTKEYKEHEEWLRSVLSVEFQHSDSFTAERKSRHRLSHHPITMDGRSDLEPEEHAALALFHWTAKWIAEEASTDNDLRVRPTKTVGGGYWPDLVGKDSLNLTAEKAGSLTKLPDQNISATVEGFIKHQYISENGWPHPTAALKHFEYCLKNRTAKEQRQVALLLVGLVQGELVLRDVKTHDVSSEGPNSTVSLDQLVKYHQTDKSEHFASLVIVQKGTKVVMGFNSPRTLLCPVPGHRTDQRLRQAWDRLSKRIIGSQYSRDADTNSINQWNSQRAIRQIQTWIYDVKKYHSGIAPPWTAVFDPDADSIKRSEYGLGHKVPVFWGATNNKRSPVEIYLPTGTVGKYPRILDATRIVEQEMLDLVPEIKKYQYAEDIFTLTEFQRPNVDQPVRAIWKRHLSSLQRDGKIGGFRPVPDTTSLYIVTPDLSTEALLDNIIVLDIDDIRIRACTPMEQRDSSGKREHKLPDYPVRSDYLGLVQTDAGLNVLDLLKDCTPFDLPSPVINNGKRRAIWTLKLRGCTRGVPVSLSLPAPDEDPHSAHWMVWPSFRSLTGPDHWLAYYIYEHCTDPRVHLRILWLSWKTQFRLRCSASDAHESSGMRPVRFVSDNDRHGHTGGPPIAVSAENTSTNQELGLYVIQLKGLRKTPELRRVSIGIDFGTSHTIAAVMTDDKTQLVSLTHDLDTVQSSDRLTHTLSENIDHVKDPDDGLAKFPWLPTYEQSTLPNISGLIPSELLTIQPLERMTGTDVHKWIPGRDYVIPPMDIQREDLADHLLADFKWDASFPAFRGKEPRLREIYLGMVTELVLADIVARTLKAIPSAPVDFTFTYPLRSRGAEVSVYKKTVEKMLSNAQRSLGVALQLKSGIGLYNESLAAKGGTETFGDVCLVGDLGGMTLDLFISANEGPGTIFEEVADSVRLGGNRLLRILAENSTRFLPNGGGWSGEVGRVETKLRTWMRHWGSEHLFGTEADPAARIESLNLSGFSQPSDSNEARTLINRYFYLIEEYMARSLAAFLAREWYPKVMKTREDVDRLCVYVQLRGNGWRLWHQMDDYGAITQQVASSIEQRITKNLWVDGNLWQGYSAPQPDSPNCRLGESSMRHSKSGPISEAVGKALAHNRVSAYQHALVELELRFPHNPDNTDPQSDKIRWFNRMPYDTRRGQRLDIEFRTVEPPLSLESPGSRNTSFIKDLETDLKKYINDQLDKRHTKDGSKVNVPVARLVWETILKSRNFVGDK